MNYGIILAAGSGLRFGSFKQFDKINNKEIFLFSLYKFLNSNIINKTIIVVNNGKVEFIRDILRRERIDTELVDIVVGGETRFLSLINGLNFIYKVYSPKDNDNVIIHDAARPNFSVSTIEKIINGLEKFEVITLGYKITDSLKKAQKLNSLILIEEDIDRENIWAVTTPQGYKIKLFKEILEKKELKNSHNIKNIYDETTLFLKDKKVLIIEDTRYNIKITYQEDLNILKKIMSD